MSFLKEYFHNMYTKYATVDTFRSVMTVVTPLLLAKEYIVSYVKSFIPSHIKCIIHFDTDEGKVTERYIAHKKGYSMKNALYEMMDLPKDGYYMIVVWNNLKQTNEHYILQANLVESALEIRNVYNLWMLHDFAISILLSNFVTYSNLRETKIKGLTVNHKDVTKILKPYLKCFSIPKNIRPNVLYMLSQYLSHQTIDPTEVANAKCIYMNEDLDEVQIDEANKYILISTMRSHPVCSIRPNIYQCDDCIDCDEKEKDDFYKEEDEEDEEDEIDEINKEEDMGTGGAGDIEDMDYKNNILYSDPEIEEIFEKESNTNIKKRKINNAFDDTVRDVNGNIYTKDTTV